LWSGHSCPLPLTLPLVQDVLPLINTTSKHPPPRTLVTTGLHRRVIQRVYDGFMKRIRTFLLPLGVLLSAALILQGCGALNPFCGSARPAPSIATLSASTITFAQVQQGYLLTVNGTHLVSASVVVINGTTLTTQVVSNTELQVTLTDTLITGPGSASVTVHTPGGNSADLGCSSGGTSDALTLTIT
jgi:hypothetical protein